MSPNASLFCAGALVLAVIGLSACASAPTEEGAMAAAEVDKIVCRREADTGSRLPKKTCKKQSEWDAIAEDNEQIRRNLERDSTAGTITDGGRQ